MSNVQLITGGKTKLTQERPIHDFYPTPTASTVALFKSRYLPLKEITNVLEPAAGQGHISKVCEKFLPKAKIVASDLIDYGSDCVIPNVDFLKENFNGFDLIITNPPYNSKILMPFVKKAIKETNRFVAMFLKLTFLEGIKRREFFKQNKQLKYVLVFSNRQPMYKGGIKTRQSNAIAYAWYIWDKKYLGLPQIDWLDNSKLIKEIEEY